MILKNTFKIMFLNFPLILKSCLYKLIIICISLLMGYGVLSPIINECEKVGMWDKVFQFFSQGIFAFDGSVVISQFQSISADFSSIMSANVGFTWNFLALFLLVAVFLPVMLGLSKVAEFGVLFGSLSCNSKFEFMTSYFENFKKGFVFRLFRLVFSIPCLVLCLAIAYLVPMFLVGDVATIFAIIIVILSIIAICALFMTLFLIYEPNLIIKETKPWHALTNSVKEVKKFGMAKIYFMVLLFLLIAFILNAFFAAISYGFALIITIPITLQFSNVIRMILCYDILGMDYYISKKSVCVTKKYCEKITMDNMKDLI